MCLMEGLLVDRNFNTVAEEVTGEKIRQSFRFR